MFKAHQSEAVLVLDQDPELAEGLGGIRLESARAQAEARTIEVARGSWDAERGSREVRQGLGMLVLDGLVLRRVGLNGRYGAEILAKGDILRPWEAEGLVASVPRSAEWFVLRRARLALLDLEFARRIAPFPEIHTQLVARALRRSRYLAVQMAIVHQPKVEARVHMLLWHLADRWGTVHADGVHLPVRLTHSVLADLLAASRPTVSAAVASLQRDGRVARQRGGWVLHGSPPGELDPVGRPALDA